MDEKNPLIYHKISMVDIELAESKDEPTAAPTTKQQQQQRKRQRRAAIKDFLKGLERCVILSLAFLGFLMIVLCFLPNRWWNTCEAAGGHVVSFVNDNRIYMHCEGLHHDARGD